LCIDIAIELPNMAVRIDYPLATSQRLCKRVHVLVNEVGNCGCRS
jgi:hypothetical protein